MKTKNRQSDAKADKSGSDLQNENLQKMEVQTSSFCGISFGINRLMSILRRSRAENVENLDPGCGVVKRRRDLALFRWAFIDGDPRMRSLI
jgi:hypothetical protein